MNSRRGRTILNQKDPLTKGPLLNEKDPFLTQRIPSKTKGSLRKQKDPFENKRLSFTLAMASMKKDTRAVRQSRGTGNPKRPWSGSDKSLLLKLQAEMLPGSTYEQLASRFNASGPQQQRTVNALTKKLAQYRRLGGRRIANSYGLHTNARQEPATRRQPFLPTFLLSILSSPRW
jgi:hypothetical protein